MNVLWVHNENGQTKCKPYVWQLNGLETCWFNPMVKITFCLQKKHAPSCDLHTTIQNLQNEVKGCSAQVHELSVTVQRQKDELKAIRKEFNKVGEELCHTKRALKDITHELQVLEA